jgi:predicted RNase H-like HicB family nuclease
MNDKYTIVVRRDGPYYVALCLELNVSSQGASLEEARRNVGEAIEEYLAFMRDENSLDEIHPVPFDILREFLLEGLGETQQADMEVLAVAA